MKRKSDLLEWRNRLIRADFQRMKKEGLKSPAIFEILSGKYFLEPITIKRICYDMYGYLKA